MQTSYTKIMEMYLCPRFEKLVLLIPLREWLSFYWFT